MFDNATTTDSERTTDTYEDDIAYGGRSLVALFGDGDSARQAARGLHDEGFHDIWLGVTHAATSAAAPLGMGGSTASTAPVPAGNDVVVEPIDESLGDKIGRFFSGESQARSLYDELRRHGVDAEQARRIEDQIPAETAVLTVDGANHPEAAATILERSGGHLVAGEGFESTASSDADRESLRGSDVLGYRDPQRYARGSEIDDERRVQLRAERLSVDKRREAIGEATIGKDVVETQQDVDVPVVREELFVQRRPASDTRSEAVAPIGDANDTIRIPLMRERVVVSKRPVVTGEYVVGKRAVTETEHVSETTREERLRVNGGAADRSDVAN